MIPKHSKRLNFINNINACFENLESDKLSNIFENIIKKKPLLTTLSIKSIPQIFFKKISQRETIHMSRSIFYGEENKKLLLKKINNFEKFVISKNLMQQLVHKRGDIKIDLKNLEYLNKKEFQKEFQKEVPIAFQTSLPNPSNFVKDCYPDLNFTNKNLKIPLFFNEGESSKHFDYFMKDLKLPNLDITNQDSLSKFSIKRKPFTNRHNHNLESDSFNLMNPKSKNLKPTYLTKPRNTRNINLLNNYESSLNLPNSPFKATSRQILKSTFSKNIFKVQSFKSLHKKNTSRETSKFLPLVEPNENCLYNKINRRKYRQKNKPMRLKDIMISKIENPREPQKEKFFTFNDENQNPKIDKKKHKRKKVKEETKNEENKFTREIHLEKNKISHLNVLANYSRSKNEFQEIIKNSFDKKLNISKQNNTSSVFYVRKIAF